MATKRIYELTHDANPADNVNILLDSPDFVEPKQCTKAELFADEVIARTEMDDAIKEGAGLETDGSLAAIPSSTYLRNRDFTQAGLDITLKNMAILLDRAVLGAVNNIDRTMVVSLSSAEILTLKSAPVQKISQPEIGTFYDIRRVIARLNFVNTAYSGGGNVEMYYTGGEVIAKFDVTFLCSAATKTASTECVIDLGLKEYEILPDTGISFRITGADPTLGDGTIDFLIDYRMRTISSATSVIPQRCCLTPVIDTFVNGDLTAGGNLVVAHNLNTTNVFITVKDNTGAFVAATFTVGDESGLDTFNKITIVIGGPITGTWDYMVIGKTV